MKRHYTGTSSKNFAAVGDPKTASQSKLLTAGYRVGESDRARLGGFLKQCGYCRKQIAINSDVFMYGDLRGFCSAECRDNQIVQDQSAKGKRANAK